MAIIEKKNFISYHFLQMDTMRVKKEFSTNFWNVLVSRPIF